MSRRAHDFAPAQKDIIKAYFGNVCAACGEQNARLMQADHWISGESSDDGVCLCVYCNVNVKGSTYIPNFFRLAPRAAVQQGAEYIERVHANQDAFAAWVSQFRFCVKSKAYRHEKFKPLVTPW
jgi:hypothetical protein